MLLTFDPEITKSIHSRNTIIVNEDFILHNTEIVYDLVIANPPYVEIRKFDRSKIEKYAELYESILMGKSNIYILFIKKIIDCLELNGIAVLIIPTAFRMNMNAISCRKYMFKHCNIIDMINYGNFSSQVSQSVMILMIEKVREKPVNDSQNYVIDDNGKYLVRNSNEITVKSTGCIVRNGTFVWNQNKDNLTASETTMIVERGDPMAVEKGDLTRVSENAFVLYAANIGDKSVELLDVSKNRKYQYFSGSKLNLPTPFIAIKRITSDKINAILIREFPKKIIPENHVITISGNIEILERIYLQLSLSNFRRRATGSNMLSVGEVNDIVLSC